MVIKRDLYLNQLIEAKNNGMIKVITGIRRSGKSFLLFNLFYGYLISQGIDDSHIIRFAFDSDDYLSLIGENILDIDIRKRKVNAKKFSSYIKSKIKDNSQYYLLLDEVQYLESFEAVLNGYLGKDNLDIYVTGSNAKFLSKDIITEFRGRGWEIHVNPLSLLEFKQVYDGSISDAYKEYSLYGGLPKILEFKDTISKVKYLNSIFEETYIKDIMERNIIKNQQELDELLNFLASSIGSLTNPKKLSDTFLSVKKVKIHTDTISKYLEYLSDAYLIASPKRYDISGKGYINSPLKYYFTDLGLRNAKLNFREIEEQKIMENIIYNELVCRGFKVDVGSISLYEKNKEGKSVLKKVEVDFVCNLGDKRYYIQVAYTLDSKEKLEQEERSLLNIKDAFKKIIIVKDTLKPHYNEEGIYILGLYDFLLDIKSLDY